MYDGAGMEIWTWLGHGDMETETFEVRERGGIAHRVLVEGTRRLLIRTSRSTDVYDSSDGSDIFMF